MNSSPPANPAPERIPALDGLRGVAILLVLVMHAGFPGIAVDSSVSAPLLHGYLWVALLGWCGVDVFFVLSGFLITGILVRAKGSPHYFRDFYARRALRIFPLYYLALLLLFVVLPRPAAAAPGEAWASCLYVQNWLYGLRGVFSDPARTITWSLAIEEQFYLLWPALVLWTTPQGLRRLCVATIVGAIALRAALLLGGAEHVYFLTPCRLDALAAGALLAVVPLPTPRFGQLATLVGAAGLAGVAAYAGSPLTERSPSMQGLGLVASLLLAVGLLVLGRGEGLVARALRWRWLGVFGRYSYCIYLTHVLVIEVVGRWWMERTGQWAHAWPLLWVLGLTVLSIVASLVVGVASWHLFEKWFLQLKRYFPGSSG
jgi:peptidoglycan/LPS O-acetylase OafA/YrhL